MPWPLPEPATWPASLTASRRTGSRRRPSEARTNQPSHGFLVPDRLADNPGPGREMAPDGRKPVPVPGRPLVTVLVHDPALPDDRERLDTAAATQLRPSTCTGSRPARRHAGLTTTQRKPPRPASLTLTDRAPWRTQLHAYSEHRIRRYAPGATPILSCECPLYNRRSGALLGVLPRHGARPLAA